MFIINEILNLINIYNLDLKNAINDKNKNINSKKKENFETL